MLMLGPGMAATLHPGGCSFLSAHSAHIHEELIYFAHRKFSCRICSGYKPIYTYLGINSTELTFGRQTLD